MSIYLGKFQKTPFQICDRECSVRVYASHCFMEVRDCLLDMTTFQRLRRNDSSMIHWMYCTKPQDKTTVVSLLDRLELLLHRLRWYGHVRRSDCIHAVTELEESFPGRPFKT